MTRTVIAIILFAVTIAASVMCDITFDRNCEELLNTINEISSCAYRNDTDGLGNARERLSDIIENKQTLFHILLDHAEFSDTEETMRSIIRENDNNLIIELCGLCTDKLEHLMGSYSLTFGNVL